MKDEFVQWITRSYHRTRVNGTGGRLEVGHQLYKNSWRAGINLPIGNNVFDYDWDLLIVLDGCRVDTLRECAGDYGVLGSVDSTLSVGSSSMEWIEKTFTQKYTEEVSRTAYLTANPHSPTLSERGRLVLATLDEIWRYGFDESLGTIPPRS